VRFLKIPRFEISPSEWAAALIEKVSEVTEKKPAKKAVRKKAEKKFR
jgi:hypothetical protein